MKLLRTNFKISEGSQGCKSETPVELDAMSCCILRLRLHASAAQLTLGQMLHRIETLRVIHPPWMETSLERNGFLFGCKCGVSLLHKTLGATKTLLPGFVQDFLRRRLGVGSCEQRNMKQTGVRFILHYHWKRSTWIG